MHKSVYINTLDDSTLEALSGLNLDSVFVSQSKLTKDVLQNIKTKTSAEIYGKVTGFEGQPLLDKYPDAKPVAYGDTETSKDWYVGVCPTHPGVRAEIESRIDSLINLGIDGIWLQFMHYPTKWDEIEPVIMDTCYCNRCISKFEDYVGDAFEYSDMEELFLLIDGSYYQEWLDFKASQITSMVKYAKDKITASAKDIKLGYFTVPWDESEYSAALQRVLGQERTQLTPLVDVTSPMLYHKLCGKDVSWIGDKVDYFWNLGADFLPVIQSELVSDKEFKEALQLASKSPSFGVCVYLLDDLLEDSSRLKHLKSFFEVS